MSKIRFGLIPWTILLLLSLVGCTGNVSNSSQNDTNRYPGTYNTEQSDYSKIQIKDDNGNEISHIAIDLWYAANEIYNVDESQMFEMGEYDVPLTGYTIGSNELLNYDAVVEDVFTQDGIQQLEQTMIGGPEPLIRKQDGKVYRMSSWKTGYSFANALTDMQVKELMGDRITLAVAYAPIGVDNILDSETVEFTIAKVGGTWLVDDYVYPEAYQS